MLARSFLNPSELCDARKFKVMKLGIQSATPGDPGEDDFFEGGGGRRVAGVIKVCPLEDNTRMASVGLAELVVFAQGNSDYEISIRPIVTTLEPENIVNRAALYFIYGDGTELGPFNVPLSTDSDYDEHNANTVKFNVGAPATKYETKVIGTELDSLRFSLRVEVDHVVTVKRPVYQPIDFYAQLLVTHITYCGCSKSGGSCSEGGTCSCSCSTNRGYAEFEYYPDHYRVESESREYSPNTEASDVMHHFRQVFHFESTVAAFDKAYTDLIYVEPTPRPGEHRSRITTTQVMWSA